MTGRLWIMLGALSGASAVAMAAAAAHALPDHLDAKAMQAVLGAVQMQAWHALALVFTGLWVMRSSGWAARLGHGAGAGFALGAALFSGAIYGHHLLGVASGPAAPLGGVLLILAWLLLAASARVA